MAVVRYRVSRVLYLNVCQRTHATTIQQACTKTQFLPARLGVAAARTYMSCMPLPMAPRPPRFCTASGVMGSRKGWNRVCAA
jgi:hypothetical protein